MTITSVGHHERSLLSSRAKRGISPSLASSCSPRKHSMQRIASPNGVSRARSRIVMTKNRSITCSHSAAASRGAVVSPAPAPSLITSTGLVAVWPSVLARALNDRWCLSSRLSTRRVASKEAITSAAVNHSPRSVSTNRIHLEIDTKLVVGSLVVAEPVQSSNERIAVRWNHVPNIRARANRAPARKITDTVSSM